MANFESFRWNFSSGTNPEFGRSGPQCKLGKFSAVCLHFHKFLFYRYFFGANGGYLLAQRRYRVGLDFDITMQIKPRNISGMYCSKFKK